MKKIVEENVKQKKLRKRTEIEKDIQWIKNLLKQGKRKWEIMNAFKAKTNYGRGAFEIRWKEIKHQL